MSAETALQLALGFGLGALSVGLWRGVTRKRVSVPTQLRRRQPIPDLQLREWISAAPQGWLVLDGANRIEIMNERAESLLVRGGSLAPQIQHLNDLEPSAELLHLLELCRNTGLAQRGEWSIGRNDLSVRVMPGERSWLALQIEGSNPLKLQLQQQEQWVSDVAHELKTPITALRLVSESLSLKAEGRQAVLVERLEKELERLQKLVGDLLDLSRLDNALASRSRPPAAIDPRDVIGQAWATLQELAIPRGIELQIEPKRDQARQVCVEPARLHQAVFNLIDNALRYSPDGKSIDLSIEERDRWCLIAVRDHGPGFSATDLDRMFERFYRGDPARARGPRNGSGLGLAIVRQIALSQGGLVRARNHPGGGAVVELLLPRA
ncbi:cell wall metabolism sensor histidine kinase WalK [Synechococcus sp. LTW-R]|uniref:sensor histidine kinase n=1 Tax=Synechococcus sp. LTW-R TaxID=2751170 RepID=UPI00162A26D7|nr:HAMP domain-containing sensor histidine kinase [Synechococcus sp. LTW-R]QNG30458.1 HAMP domain-containing histidine kinase [Synechococcus sp. LTW-R]